MPGLQKLLGIKQFCEYVQTIKNALGLKVDKVSGKGLSTNDYTNDDKNKLAGIEAGAEKNQDAFSNVKVGSDTVSADTDQDTLELVAGSNVTLTPDTTNNTIAISATVPPESDLNNYVLKTGDTMTGSLHMKDNGIDTSATPSSDEWGSAAYEIVDKNGTQIGYIDGANLSNGTQGIEFVGIKRINGTPYRNGFYLGLKSDGSQYVSFSNDASRVAWLTALNVGTISMAGTTSGTQSVSHATVTAVKTLSLVAGTWIIVGQVDYASGGNAGTYRAAWLGNSSSQRQYAASEVASPTTGNCTVQAVTIQKFTAATTIYLNAFQGSGGALNVNNSATYIVAIRIG